MERLYLFHQASLFDNCVAKVFELAHNCERSVGGRRCSAETHNCGFAQGSCSGGRQAASSMGCRVAQGQRGVEYCDGRRLSEGSDNRLLWGWSTLWSKNPIQRPYGTRRNG